MMTKKTNKTIGIGAVALVLALCALTAQAEWTVNVETGRHGSVEPAAAVQVADGEDLVLHFRPHRGYRVDRVLLDGDPVTIADDDTWVLPAVERNHAVNVEFAPDAVRGLPFREDFSSRDPGSLPLNIGGWYGDPMDLSVEILQTQRRQAVASAGETDRIDASTNVMRIFGSSVTRYFEDKEADRVWIDLRMRTDLVRHTNINVEADTQMAFYVNGEGRVVLYHRDVQAEETVWTELQETLIEEEEWIRLTVMTDYRSIADGGPFFQLYLNGVRIADAKGVREPRVAAAAGGPWFATATPGRRSVGAVTLSGTGYLEEVAVDSDHEGFPDQTHTIRGAVADDGGGTLSHAGDYRVPHGWTKRYDLQPEPGHAVIDVRVDGDSVGAPASYTFENVRRDHTIEAVFAPVIDVRWIGNGRVDPGGTVLRRLGQPLALAVHADPGHHLVGIRAQRGLDGEFEAIPGDFGPGVTHHEYTWGEVNAPGAVEAEFAVDQHTLTVHSEWGGALVNGQSVTPGATLRLPWGSEIRLTIEHSPLQLGDQRFVCTGWQGQGSVPDTGRGTDTGKLVLREDTVITWEWREE